MPRQRRKAALEYVYHSHLTSDSTSNADVMMSMFYTYPASFTTITFIFILVILIVSHWLVKKCAPSCLCNLFFITLYYKSKLKRKKIELQDVCPTDGTDLVAMMENVRISGRTFPAGVDIDYSNVVFRREIGKGNFGKVYHGYLQMNEVQR